MKLLAFKENTQTGFIASELNNYLELTFDILLIFGILRQILACFGFR